jgi:hypothetical protein
MQKVIRDVIPRSITRGEKVELVVESHDDRISRVSASRRRAIVEIDRVAISPATNFSSRGFEKWNPDNVQKAAKEHPDQASPTIRRKRAANYS